MTPEQIEKEKQAFEEWFNGKINEEPDFRWEVERFDARLGWMAAKEHAAKQSGWISVEDKYPESSDTEVNVLLSDGTVRIALYQHFVPFAKTDLERSFTGDIYHIDGAEYTCQLFENVTHWQPLPASPEKE